MFIPSIESMMGLARVSDPEHCVPRMSTYTKKGTGISQWKVAHNLLSNTACNDDAPEEVSRLPFCYHDRALMDRDKAHTGFLR
jgi:hypothetical protein